MRYSQLLLPTLKETPTEAEVVSHRLLLRAGFIRKLTSGVYTYLPLGLAAIRKVEQMHLVIEQMVNPLESLAHADWPGDRCATNFQHALDLIQ